MILAAKKEKLAVPTISKAVGMVAKDLLTAN